MIRRLVPFILLLSLATPSMALAGTCCRSDDTQTIPLIAETCGCQDVGLCAGDEAAESLLEARLVAPSSSHRTPTVLFLTTDLSRVRSVTESRPFRLASARAPTPAPLTITLPLRL